MYNTGRAIHWRKVVVYPCVRDAISRFYTTQRDARLWKVLGTASYAERALSGRESSARIRFDAPRPGSYVMYKRERYTCTAHADFQAGLTASCQFVPVLCESLDAQHPRCLQSVFGQVFRAVLDGLSF